MSAASFIHHALTTESIMKLLLAFMVLFLYHYRSRAIESRQKRDIKEPRGSLPLLGHSRLLAAVPDSRLHHFFEKQSQELGPVWSMTLPIFGRIIQIDSPQLIEYVLRTNFWNYTKGPMVLDILKDLGGDEGIATSEGNKWKFQRKLAARIFSVKDFQEHSNNVFVAEGKKVIDYLGKAADEGSVVDMKPLVLAYTLDCLGAIAFGRLVDPVWKIRERLTDVGRKVKYHRDVIRNHALGIIKERGENGHPAKKSDFLQYLMESFDDEGQPLTEDMIIDNILNIMNAGRESMASALTWMFYSLYRQDTDKGIANTLVQEVDDILGGSDPAYDTYKKQKFAEACFNETLRLFPALPRIMRYCGSNDVLPDGTKVYAGEYVSWSLYAMGRSEAVWGPDAKEFKPSRWINSPKPSQGKFNAFGGGPRVCMGQQFAVNQVVTIMGMILQSFKVCLEEPSKEQDYGVSFILPMRDGLMVRVSRRQPCEP
ncbi:hypothetical protein BGX27_008672 [Mortierella sp. AM989]|nr:hypothetical protein BGX27_008672 [Mortierella sp. AM989]